MIAATHLINLIQKNNRVVCSASLQGLDDFSGIGPNIGSSMAFENWGITDPS